jgi:hypothetical protein
VGKVEGQGEWDGEPLAPLPSPARVRRSLCVVVAACAAASAAGFIAVAPLRGFAAVNNPVLWAAVAAFWGAVICSVYLIEVRGVERALGALAGISIAGMRVIWLPEARSKGLGANIEVRASASSDALPSQFEMLLSVNVFGDLDVVALSASWSCNASGVLLLSPHAARFLEGATTESLSLPSQEEAAIRGLFFPPGEPDAIPKWGAHAGPRAREAIAEVHLEEWLFGPEQPFVAFEAFGARIEKFWSPLSTRLVDLDLASALDVLRVVRAFDRDAVEGRRAGPTSSPPSPRPSSPRP